MLTEEEEEAVAAANLLYDATPADQELTESGTVGEASLALFSFLFFLYASSWVPTDSLTV